jgi:hypothetical protein
MDRLLQWVWQFGVDYFLYLILLLTALWTTKTIMFSSLKEMYFSWNYRNRFRKLKTRAVMPSQPYRYPLLQHLNILIRTTRGSNTEKQVEMFILFSGLLGIFSAVFVILIFRDIFIASIFGFLLASIPYLFLRLRLNKIRHLMSNEFLFIVQRLTQNYNAMHYDMYYALSETQNEVKSAQLRKILIKLISDLQVSRNENELRETIQVFAYTAGTNWSKRLGSIILKAYLYNEKVLNALIVLTKQMEELEEMLQEEKSQTLDTVVNGYITLPLFIGSLALGYYSSGAQDWGKLQFGTESTLLLFSLSVLGIVFSIIISIFLKHPKNDL